ncbi:hypothetical protein [Leptospira alstonii]|nr:hypothetical protein [Leptospira alstonii]
MEAAASAKAANNKLKSESGGERAFADRADSGLAGIRSVFAQNISIVF